MRRVTFVPRHPGSIELGVPRSSRYHWLIMALSRFLKHYRDPVRLTIICALVVPLTLTIVTGRSAYAQSTDDSLRVHAVHIVQDPPQSWTGYGIYLGNGLVITAAHVVGRVNRTKPSVRVAGLDLPARAVKEGRFERIDLTLLAFDDDKLPVSIRMRRMPVCEHAPWVGEPVIVVIPEGTARSHVMSPWLIPRNSRTRFSTVIRDVATTGNSGSGVIDDHRKCLLGIMSRKIQVRSSSKPDSPPVDIAKYFVPASTIRAFLPTEYRH